MARKKTRSIDDDIRTHRIDESLLEMATGGAVKARPRVRPKYEPAPMPSDASVDAVLARIRAARPNK